MRFATLTATEFPQCGKGLPGANKTQCKGLYNLRFAVWRWAAVLGKLSKVFRMIAIPVNNDYSEITQTTRNESFIEVLRLK